MNYEGIDDLPDDLCNVKITSAKGVSKGYLAGNIGDVSELQNRNSRTTRTQYEYMLGTCVLQHALPRRFIPSGTGKTMSPEG